MLGPLGTPAALLLAFKPLAFHLGGHFILHHCFLRVQPSLHVYLYFLDIISRSVLQTLDSSLTLILLSLSQLVKTQPCIDAMSLVTDYEVGDEQEVAFSGPDTQDGGQHGLTLVAGPT